MRSLSAVTHWTKRIERAEELTKSRLDAAEVLKFYVKLAEFQERLYSRLESLPHEYVIGGGTLSSNWPTASMLPHFPSLLALTAQFGPHHLAATASELAGASPSDWKALISDFWETDTDRGNRECSTYAFFAPAFLQPWAERCVLHSATRFEAHQLGTCPVCFRKPVLGILRAEGDGAKRSLLCSLCGTEWAFRRIVCPACGEEDVKQLPVYTAAGFEYIRIEACDSCKTYIKTIDLTINGRAVPVVDELAALPLALWALGRGYIRLQANLLGT